MARWTFLLMSVLLLLADSVVGQRPPSAPDPLSLLPGDMIRVQVWREEDLGGEFLVDTNGVVTLPLIGDYTVTGLGIDRVRDMLVEAYRRHLRNPSIVVTPLRTVNVLGEVQKPGLYPLDPTVTLAGAVAVAGGTTTNGDLGRIRVIRDGQVVRSRLGVGETLNELGIRSGDQVIVDRRGWLDRNGTTLLASGLSIFGSILTTLIILSRT